MTADELYERLTRTERDALLLDFLRAAQQAHRGRATHRDTVKSIVERYLDAECWATDSTARRAVIA